MLTVRDRVEALVGESPFLRDALGEGLINVSSLARRLQPQVQIELRKDITVDAVFMALKRYSATLAEKNDAVDPRDGIGEMTLRTGLFQLTLAHSERVLQTMTQILLQSRPGPDTFLTFTATTHELTITASDSLRDSIEMWLQNEKITFERDGITAISMRRLRESSGVGTLQLPQQVLTWNGVDVIDVVSTTNELMVLLNDRDVDRAISALRLALRKPTKDEND